MSGKAVEKLKRRSRVFLREARRLLEEGEYDLACFNAEQALQLFVKSTVLRLLGEEIRGHGVRSILGYLAGRLREMNYRELAERIAKTVSDCRYGLVLLEDAYVDARYGLRSFSEEEAREAIRIVEEFIRLLEDVEENVWMG